MRNEWIFKKKKEADSLTAGHLGNIIPQEDTAPVILQVTGIRKTHWYYYELRMALKLGRRYIVAHETQVEAQENPKWNQMKLEQKSKSAFVYSISL